MNSNKSYCGRSVTTCDYIIEEQLARIQPKRIVDFGAGSGKNAEIVRKILGFTADVLAVEANKSTTEMLSERSLYNKIYSGLIQDWVLENKDTCDLALFGDVLEHLKPKEVHRVIRECHKYYHNMSVTQYI